MRSVFVGIFLAMFLVLNIPVHLILLVIGKFNLEARYKIGNVFVYWGFKVELFISGAHPIVKGKENIPQGAVLFVPNHRSYFDILLLHTTSGKRPGFVAKAEMKKLPLLSSWMTNICCLFLDRKDMKSGLQMIKSGVELLKSGHSMVICPEGTRNSGKELMPFKEGSLKMAEKADCPVVPVAIVNTDQMLEVRPGFRIRKGKPIVVYGKPFYIKDLPKEERKHVGAYTQQLVAEMIAAEGGQIGRPEE